MYSEREKKKIPILMYHSISNEATQNFRQFAVPPEIFAIQIEYLYEQAFTPLTVTQLADMLRQEEESLPERPIVLTFDDGFADFFTEALPILKRYNFPATLYVSTGYIEGTSRWLEREGEGSRLMLNWEQLTEISRSGIECGGHTHSHPQLDILPINEARQEIVRSKEILEDRLHQAVTTFAYPHGYHSPAVKRLTQQAGYTSACAVKYQMSSTAADPFAFSRLLVKHDTDRETLKAILAQPIASGVKTVYTQMSVPLWRLARKVSATTAQHYE